MTPHASVRGTVAWQAEVQALKTRVQEADQRSEAAVAVSARLQELATRQTDTVSSLASSRNKLEVRAKSTEQELADARETVTQLTRQLEAAAAREAHLQDVVASGKAAVAAAQARVVEAQAGSARAEQRAEEAEDALGVATSEAEALRRDVNRQKDLRAAAVMGGAKEQERIQECVACAQTLSPRIKLGLHSANQGPCPPRTGSSHRSVNRRRSWTPRQHCCNPPRQR